MCRRLPRFVLVRDDARQLDSYAKGCIFTDHSRK